MHAFNMAMGSHVFSGDSVLSHISLLEHTLTQHNLTHISLRHFYTPGVGKFNIKIINHYLHYLPWNANFNFYLHYSRTDLQRGQINQNLVEVLPSSSAYASAIILTSKNRTGQLHAKALRKVENAFPHAQSTWCLLDSENSYPIYLTTEDSWHQLSGNILTIQSGSFWSHFAATSDLHRADPHIPFLGETTANQNDSTIHEPNAAPLPQHHARDHQSSPATTPQHIESAQLHTPANISTGPNQTWHDYFKIITMNVRGLFKSKDDVYDLITHHYPDIISLTETKITEGVETPQ